VKGKLSLREALDKALAGRRPNREELGVEWAAIPA
jgi:hypothetical protein